MKFIIVFFVALIAVVYGQTKATPAAIAIPAKLIDVNMWRQCTQESKVDQEEVNRFKNRDFTNSRENIQCFTNCLLEKMGLIKNGDILAQQVTQALSQSGPADQITAKVTACHGQARGGSKCENAYKFYVCLLNSTGNVDIFRFAEMN